jgi:hypothetical protein
MVDNRSGGGNRRLERVPPEWCTVNVVPGVDREKAGIYEWHIEGVGTYIGKYKRIRRPTKEYRRNVARLLNDLPYRKGKPDGFRRIHRELFAAHRAGTKITLTILENVADAALRALRESALIRERGSLNDPPFGRSN